MFPRGWKRGEFTERPELGRGVLQFPRVKRVVRQYPGQQLVEPLDLPLFPLLWRELFALTSLVPRGKFHSRMITDELLGRVVPTGTSRDDDKNQSEYHEAGGEQVGKLIVNSEQWNSEARPGNASQ